VGARAVQDLQPREEVRLVILQGKPEALAQSDAQKIEVVIKKAYALLIGGATLLGPVLAVFIHTLIWKSSVDARFDMQEQRRQQDIIMLRLEREENFVKKDEWERWTQKLETMSSTLSKLDGYMSAREDRKK
jgi:hypothetical protein